MTLRLFKGSRNSSSMVGKPQVILSKDCLRVGPGITSVLPVIRELARIPLLFGL